MKMKNTTLLAGLLTAVFPLTAPAQQGLLGEYYKGANFETKVLSRTDARIYFNWQVGESPAPGVPSSDFSVRWTGKLKPPKSGKYVFSAKVDDGIRVWVGGHKVLDAWGLHDSENFSGSIDLKADQAYDLKVEYFNGIFEGEIQLLWTLPGEGNALLNWFGSAAKPVDAQYFTQPAASPTPAQPAPVKKQQPQKTSPPKKAAKSKPEQKPAAENPPSPPPAPTPAELKVKQRSLELKFIYFERSKDVILPESRATLDDWVEFLRQKPEATIDIAGHTDDLGNAAKNQQLSEERARIVADYLITKGLDKNRIRTKGYGGNQPIYVNPATEKERALNRRVEIRAR